MKGQNMCICRTGATIAHRMGIDDHTPVCYRIVCRTADVRKARIIPGQIYDGGGTKRNELTAPHDTGQT